MRETWIYGLAFLLILGVGGALLWPRLEGGAAYDGPEVITAIEEAPEAETPVEEVVPGSVEPLLDGARTLPAPEVAFRLEATRPLEVDDVEIEGAEVIGARIEGDAFTARLAPRPGAEVMVRAPGHVVVTRSAEALDTTWTLALKRASAPVTVEVVEPDGRPAAGIPLAITPRAASESPRTDARGRVVLDTLPEGRVDIAIADGARRASPRTIDTRQARAVRIMLEPAWVVEGMVRRPDGGVARSAVVTVLGPAGRVGMRAATDADGRFRWEGPAVSVASLLVRAPGCVAVQQEIRAATHGLRTNVGEIRLTSTGTSVACTLTTVVPGSQPVLEVEPQVAAVLRELFGRGHALFEPVPLERQSDGQWLAEGLPADLPLRVRVRGAGEALDVPFEGRTDELVRLSLAPRSGHVLAAVLRDPEGRPLRGVQVLLSREPRDGDRPLPDDIVARTGHDGAIQVYGLTGSTWYLRAYVPGSRSLLRRITLPLTRAPELTVEPALLDDARRVAGRVRDSKGRRLAGVTVRAAGLETRTDKDGSFVLEGVESLAPTVSLAYGYEPGPLPAGAGMVGGFLARQVQTVTPGLATDLDLVLYRTGSLRLKAMDLLTNEPLEVVHCLVQSLRDSRVVFDRAVATRDGLVEIDGLPEGAVSITLLGPELRLTTSARILGHEILDLGDQLLGRGMHVKGRVQDGVGRPLAGAFVAALDIGWQHRGEEPARERELLFRRVQTDKDGRFTLRGLDPKRPATLAFWAPDRAPTSERVLLPAFSDDVEAEVDVSLKDGSWLMLVLQDNASMQPVSGVSIALETNQGLDYLDMMHMAALGGPVSNDASWRIASEHFLFEEVEPGNYVVGPLVPGPHTLWIERPGYAPRRQRLSVLGRGENVMQERLGTNIRTRAVLGNTTRIVFLMSRVRR